MTLLPLTLEILVTFALSAYLLHRYGNFVNQHILTTVSVFIAWFFSFLVIFILPLDISNTAYRQCLENTVIVVTSTSTPNVSIHGQVLLEDSLKTSIAPLTNITNSSTIIPTTTSSPIPSTAVTPGQHICQEPWSYASGEVLSTLWRVVYWTSQVLTWIALPLMQSYSMTGEFTVIGKLKSAVKENVIFYLSFGAIFVILLVYVSIKIGLDLNGLKVICITASNTWGLFLLVVLLGYGLVEIPRSCFNTSQYARTLSYLYFRVSKLSGEKCESEEKLEDVLEEIQTAYESLNGEYDPMKPYLDVILTKCPPEWKQHLLSRFEANSGNRAQRVMSGSAYNEKSLVRIHQSVIRAMQAHHRTQCQWDLLLIRAIDWEDIAKNQVSPTRMFKSSLTNKTALSPLASLLRETILTPKVEWYWKCLIRAYFYRGLGYFLTVVSIMVIWSEMTFSIPAPISLFAFMIQTATLSYNYIFIELLSIFSIAYLCICAYYTVFRVRVFNYYYLAPHHQTDEYSLIFCGMLLCRLTPPLCLNFLGLIHLDSHITHQSGVPETSFTRIMGHMDVISFVSDGFNIYLPICICLFCLATFFQFGSKLLHNIGFEQFIPNDELTCELISEGQELVKREKNKRLRYQDTDSRGRQINFKSPTQTSQAEEINTRSHAILARTPSEESGSRQELLQDVGLTDYSTWSTLDSRPPPKGIFDDI